MILILNAGSSSLKFAVFDGEAVKLKGQVSGIGSAPRFELGDESPRDVPEVKSPTDGLHVALAALRKRGFETREFQGIGHRIVHGGTKFIQPVRVDEAVQQQLEALRALAPLHLPFGLGVLKEMRAAAPTVPNIACFDTAFHANEDELITRLPLPRDYFDRGYRRYGFHGLNYEQVVRALPQQTGKALPQRLLVLHLGSGASICAMRDGKSVATTMGFSTADGLVMNTRTGTIDPGLLVALMRDEKLSLEQVEDLLYRRSGLLGISGFSSDMRVLLASEKAEAQQAVAAYCLSAARHAASLIPALGGCDAIAFTGGIGENAALVRENIMRHLAWLGLKPTQIHVVPADEEAAIARHVAALLR